MSEASATASSPGKHLLGKGSIYTLGMVLQLSGSALAIPVVTRLLEPAEYGAVALALAIQLFVTTLSALGLPVAVLRTYFDTGVNGKTRALELIMSTALLSAGVTALALITAFVWAPLLVPVPEALLLGIAIGLPGAVITTSLAFLRAQERSVLFICISVSSSLGAQLLGILYLLVDRSTVGFLLGYGTALVVAALITVYLTGAFRVGVASWPVLRSALAYGIPTVPHTLSIFVLALGDRLVIQMNAGLAAVGQYQLSYAVGSLGMTLLSSLQNAWLPITFGSAEHLRWKTLAETAILVTRLAALTCGMIALIAQPLLTILAPSSYDPSHLAQVTAVLALSSLPWATYLPRSQVLFWTKHTRPLAWITPAAAIFNLILVLVLLPPFGLIGAAAATVLAIGFEAVVIDVAVARIVHVPWRRSLELVHYGIGIALVTIALALPDTLAGNVVRFALSALVGLALAGVIAREVLPRRTATTMDTEHARSHANCDLTTAAETQVASNLPDR